MEWKNLPYRTLVDGSSVRAQLVNSSFQTAHVESDSVNLIVTDPPYAEQDFPLSEWHDLGKFAQRVLKPGGILVVMPGSFPNYVHERVAALKQYMTHAWDMVLILEGMQGWRYYGPVNVCIQKKTLPVFYKPPVTERIAIKSDVLYSPGAEKNHHVWQQNSKIWKQLIEMFSREGDLVCDPCVGGGTTIEVCRQLGRNVIAIEKDPKTYETLKERFKL